MPPITYPGTTADGDAENALTKKLVSIYDEAAYDEDSKCVEVIGEKAERISNGYRRERAHLRRLYATNEGIQDHTNR
ncbi:MAG: hypothetical protein Q9191_006561 [Dirinaria sp. TL-2023a]